ELVLGVAREAYALVRELRLAAAPAALRDQAHVRVAVAEVLRGRQAGAGATVVLGREQLPEPQVEVVAAQLGAAGEDPGDAATSLPPLHLRRGGERDRLGAVACAPQQPALARFGMAQRRREEQRA